MANAHSVAAEGESEDENRGREDEHLEHDDHLRDENEEEKN